MSNMEKEWYIGIDFGTSNTCVIAYEAKEGRLYCDNKWEDGIHDKFFNIPTLITRDVSLKTEAEKRAGKKDDKLDYVGAEVELHPVLRPFKCLKDAAREIAPNNGLFGKNSVEYPFDECGLTSTLEMGTVDNPLPVAVRELLVQFLKKALHVEDTKLGINKDTVKKIVIGCPAPKKQGVNNGGCQISYEGILKELLAECFTGDKVNRDFIGCNGNDGIISVVPEPELAGVTYLFSDSKREEKKVLVIDIGGGTTDFSVLEYKNGKVEASNIGSCEVAGNAIDELIFNLLPDDIRQSKDICRRSKEALFAKVDNGKIVLKTEKEFWAKIADSQYSLSYYDANNESNYIVLNGKVYDKNKCVNRSKLYKGKKIEKESKAIDDIFKEIEKKLQTALDDNKITGINTIFFVGGTSIITPLREKLVDIVADTNKSYCVASFNHETDVVTMFGEENTRNIEVDGSGSVPVTCYNAVAIGACIEAMTHGDRNLICVKPNLELRVKGSSDDIRFKTTKNDLTIKTEKGVPFSWVYILEDELKYFKPLEFSVKINGMSDGLSYSRQIDDSVKQLAIVAIYSTAGIQFKVYDLSYVTFDKNTSLDIITTNSEITI